jgi:tetratricopeptide (TPR) repeat protein
MNIIVTPFSFALLVGCSGPGSANATSAAGAAAAAEQPADMLVTARALVAQQSYHEALALTDRVLRLEPGNREARLLAAEANVALSEAEPALAPALLGDAIGSYRAVLAENERDAALWLRLADCHLRNSDFTAGRDAALRAASLLRERRARPAEVAQAVLAAADNEMQVFVDARREEMAEGQKPTPPTLAKAEAVLARIEAGRAALPAEAARRAAMVQQWLGRHTEALEELQRGIAADPSHPRVHTDYQTFMAGAGRRAECVAAYKRMLEEQGELPTLVFYMGRAQFMAADGLRAQSRWAEAAAAYAEADATFSRYGDLQPGDAGTTSHWRAMCALSRARTSLEAGDRERAKRDYFAAHALDPRVVELGPDGAPLIRDSFGGTYAGGLYMIGSAIVQRSSPASLRQALDYYEEILAKHPDKIGQFYNNAALAARDLGTALAREGDEAAAKRLWERSYELYCKAVELVPDDARIANDCGLMLVYHLFRDYDRARELFDRAIELGEAQLARLAADAPETDRHAVEEAIGDAYQNIAVMMRQEGRPLAECRPFLEKAVRFYPYRNRQAAALLRGEGASGGAAPVSAAPADVQDKGAGARQQAFAKLKVEVDRLAEAGDIDGALLALDKAAKEMEGFAAFHALRGQLNLRYALSARAQNKSAALVGGLFADAVAQLKRARELDGQDVETRKVLARALFEAGEFAEAGKEATSLLSHVRSVGGGKGQDLSDVHGIRAESSARAFIAAKQAGNEDEASLRAAREAFRVLEEDGKLTEQQIQSWTAMEQWAGAGEQALDVCLRGLQRTPSSTFLLDRAVALAAELGRSDKLVERLQATDDPTQMWYLGRAMFDQAQAQWGGGKAKEAVATLDRAQATFQRSKEKNPAFADSCDQWTALCLASQGVINLSADDLNAAEAALRKAIESRPDRLAADLGGGNSGKRGILVLGAKLAEQNQLDKLEALMRAATDAVPADVDFANNHGLAARDYGTVLERQGKQEEAKAMFERSFASYDRASKLAPDNIRLRNDRALMLLYHLHRDLDTARAILEEAREEGIKRLKESPPGDAAERRDLEEGVGDCIQNLGYYWHKHGNDLEKAKAFYTESLDYYPGTRRESRRHLDTIRREQEGKGGR